jgi:putative transposase
VSENIKGYPWSSYNEYITKPIIVDADFVLSMFSADRKKAVRLFYEHTNMLNEDRCLDISGEGRLLVPLQDT